MYVGYIFALLIFCVLTTSCNLGFIGSGNSEEDNKKTNLVILAGTHSNSEIMDMYPKEKIEEVYSSFGKIRTIVVDGNPEVAVGKDGICIGEFDEQFLKKSREIKENNEDIWERDFLSNQMKHFEEEFKKIEPDDSEVDTLEAIFKAVGALESISQDRYNKEIVIYDTGLCTYGEFSFLDNEWNDMLFYDKELDDDKIKTMVEKLNQKDLIPDLSGIKVTWYGIGSTAGQQGKLTEHQKKNLKRMWCGILKAAKAISPSEKGEYDYFFSGNSHDETNYSQSVQVVSDKKKGSEDKIQPTSIPAEKLGFKRESSEFISEKEAMDVLKPYAEKIRGYSVTSILLVGTTADPKRQGGSVSLSEERAKKVRECLVKLGVSGVQMKIIGWGANPPLYNPDEWRGNSFNEDIAKENRAVYLLPEKSKKAQEILKRK